MLLDKLLKKINISDKNTKLLLIMSAYAIFLFFFINKYWISPDEYLYVDLGRSIAESYDGKICLHCLDTAHTPLVPFLISLGYHFFGIDSIIFYRSIPTIFAILSIFMFYKIAVIAFEKKEESFWAFAILLFFPGFFSFANKIYLDIPALFFGSLIIYFLLKREKYWKIGISLLLVFLTKDYFAAFFSVLILFVILVDSFKSQDKLVEKVKAAIYNCFFAFFSVFIAVILFITTMLLPYPRMLENLLIEVLGPIYWHFANLLHGTIPEAAVIGNAKEVVTSMVKLNVIYVAKENAVFEKIQEIYISSYKEIDVNVLVLPLVLVGIFSRIKYFLNNFKNKYLLIRKDLIIFFLLIMILYFNYRVSSGDHGFRIILPLMLPFVYFIYWALKEILEKKEYWINFSFGILSFLFIYFYYKINESYTIYNSVISQKKIVSLFFEYKVFVNVLLYGILALFLLFYSKINIKFKSVFLVLAVLFLCLYKVSPFAIDKYFANKKYGNEYDLIFARPFLEEADKDFPIVMTNEIPYAYYYYANTKLLPNNDSPILPVIRKKPSILQKHRVIDLNINSLNSDYICKNYVDYVFYVNNDGDKLKLNEKLDEFPLLKIIKEYRLPESGRYNWGIYKIDKSYCN